MPVKCPQFLSRMLNRSATRKAFLVTKMMVPGQDIRVCTRAVAETYPRARLFSRFNTMIVVLTCLSLSLEASAARNDAKPKKDKYKIDRNELLAPVPGKKKPKSLTANDKKVSRITSFTTDREYTISVGGSESYARGQGARLTVFDNGNFSFDPRGDSDYQRLTSGQKSDFVFTYTAAGENGSSGSAEVTITIKGVDLSPPSPKMDGPLTTAANKVLVVTADDGLLINDADAAFVSEVRVEGVDYAVSREGGVEVVLSDGAILAVQSDGSLSFDPRGGTTYQALSAEDEAVFDFFYRASNDEGESERATARIEVTGVEPSLPLARADGYATVADQVLSVSVAAGLLANDTDPINDGALVVSRLIVDGIGLAIGQTHTLSTSATLSVNADGSFVFDPTNAGLYSALTRDEPPLSQIFSYFVVNSDGESLMAAEVNLVVSPTQDNTATSATDDTITLLEGAGQVQIQVLNNDIGDPPLSVVSIAGEGAASTVSLGGQLTAVQNTLELDTNGDLYYSAWDDFNGQDTFTYVVKDVDNEQSTGTITVNVAPVNDAPDIVLGLQGTMLQGTSKTWDGRYASDGRPLGLAARIFDKDNTIYDGLGCDPEQEDCMDMQMLYFDLGEPLDEAGGVEGVISDNAACGDGNFTYTPSSDFTGTVTINFEACDNDACSGRNNECLQSNFTIDVQPIVRPPSEDFIEPLDTDAELSQQPLEIGISAVPNVLVITDDSGSMSWDFMTEDAEASGVLRYDRKNYYFLWPDRLNASWRRLETLEQDDPGEGLWRAQNSDFNKIYYNPEIQYTPWAGLDDNGNAFGNSAFSAAVTNPWRGTGARDLSRNDLARYYRWVDRGIENPSFDPETPGDTPLLIADPSCPDNVVGVTDGPSPLGSDPCREGWLVQIGPETGADEWVAPVDGLASNVDYTTNGFADGSNKFPKFSNRTDCANADFCTLAEEQQNFANFYTYARNREYAAKLALGTVFADAENVRLGFTGLQSTATKIPIAPVNKSAITGRKKVFLDAVYGINSSGSTPLRKALRGAGQYFRCAESNNIMNAFGTPGDGEVSATSNGGCPISAAPEGTCQSNTTILLTDGYWSGGSPNLSGDPDGDQLKTLVGSGASAFDGGAFKGTGTSGNTLADVAMLYYESDLHPTLADDVLLKALDISRAPADAFPTNRMHQHMKTYIISFGQTPQIEEPTDILQAIDWGNPLSGDEQAKVDDTQHAAFNGRGRLFSSSNPSQLAVDIAQVLEEIQEGEGAASAVSFSSDELEAGAILYKGSYNIKNGSGSLVAQNILANGEVSDEQLWAAEDLLDAADYESRAIFTFNDNANVATEFTVDTLTCDQKNALLTLPILGCDFSAQRDELVRKVDYFRGDRSNEFSPENGQPDGLYRGRTTRLGDIVGSSPVYVDAPNRRRRLGLPYPQGEDSYAAFAAEEGSGSRKPVLYTGANDGMLHGFDAATGAEVLAFISNEVMTGIFNNPLLDLASKAYQHKYFVDLSPVVEDVFMGSPLSLDEAINPLFSDDKSWHTLLIGGYGTGGKGYFALNITDPDAFTTEAGAEENLVFWEFTESDDVYPVDADGVAYLTAEGELATDYQKQAQPIRDLGYSNSLPVITMSNIVDDDGEREWLSIFGNGTNSTSGVGNLFLLMIDKGRDGVWCHPNSLLGDESSYREGCGAESYDFIKITTATGADSDRQPNGLGSPRAIDIDNNGSADYVYAGDMQGNFYRFDLCRADLPASELEQSDLNWYAGGVSECKVGRTVFKQWSATKLFIARSSLNEVQPAINKPIALKHPSGLGNMLVFATGSYFRNSDITDTRLQSIYGLWDRLGSDVIPQSALVQQEYTNECAVLGGDAAEDDAETICARTLSSNPVPFTPPTADDEGVLGWFNELNVANAVTSSVVDFPGERAIRNIQIRGGLAFVNSVVPRQGGTCGSETGGFALSFCPVTGGMNCTSGDIFDVNNDGEFTELDRFVRGRVAALSFGSAAPSDAAFLGERRFTQLSDGTLSSVLTNTKVTRRSGRQSWRRIKNDR